MGDVDGMAALVTGGSKGIGREVARQLAAAGAQVAICARGQEGLDDAAEAIGSETGAAPAKISADLSRPEAPGEVAARAEAALGRVDVLVNCAGAAPPGPVEQLSDDDWALALELKLMGYIRLTRELLPRMAARGFGRIVNVAGGAAKQPAAVTTSAGVANAGVLTLTKAVANEASGRGVTANAVCPGRTATERFHTLMRSRAEQAGVTVDEAIAEAVAGIPTGRITEPADVAYAVRFFAARQAGQVTGQVVFVDGGAIRAL